jgi:multicomponent Na+:H+ antiporter subunit D
LLVAALLLPLTKVMPRWACDAISTMTALFVCAICAALAWNTQGAPIVYWFGNWSPAHGMALGISFYVDPLGAGAAAFAGLLVTLAFAFSWKYFDAAGTLFHSLMLVFLAAMAGFGLSGDIFNLFVFFELMSIVAFALASYKIEEKQSIQGAINFAVTNSIGAFLVLIGIALLYGRTGVLNMMQIGAALAHHRPDGLIVVAFTLILTGFFVKGAVMPFHFWLDDAHAVAPTPLCVLFSGIMVQLSLYAVTRIYWVCFASSFAGHDQAFRALLIGAGAVTALLGALMAFSQRHLKRMLAFSTISHSGMFITGIAAFSTEGIVADAVFVVAHGLVKAALFMGSGIVLHRHGSVDAAVLRGRGRDMRPTMVLFIAAGLALAGLPPFGLFAGKTLLDDATGGLHAVWLPWVFGAASAFDGGAVLRASGAIFFGLGEGKSDDLSPRHDKKETQGHSKSTPLPMLVSAYVALALALGAGIVAVYRYPAHHLLSIGPLAETSACAVAALILAALALRTNFNVLLRPVAALRNLHDGVFTDYVLWLLFGVAIYGAAMLPALGRG